jgi:two-component system sensor histidine kinase/response regulator
MKTILVVDDEKTLRLNLCEMLMFEGFNVIEADNGAVAIQLAQAQHPDVIICDVAMPEMDGFEVLRLLKQDSETTKIPVLLLTARAEKASIQYGLEMRATDYLLKPFVFSDVLAKVRACLGGG